MTGNADTQRLVGDLIRPGIIASVDHDAKRCTVEIGGITTGPLPWLAFRSGKVRIWSPPSVGEQCILLCAEGDTNNGFVLPALYCDAFPAPSSSPDVIAVAFDDGSTMSYDMAAHALDIALGEGSATITAAGGITLNSDVTVNGTVTASTDVVAGGVSLKDHKHGGVQGGAAQTGGPV